MEMIKCLNVEMLAVVLIKLTTIRNVLFFTLSLLYTINGSGQNSVDTNALNNLINQSEKSHTDALLIYVDNKIVYKNYSEDFPTAMNIYSIRKSIISLAIGKLITDKKLNTIDKPLFEIYPEWNQGRKKDITIRHILNHTTGIQNYPLTGKEIDNSPDIVKLALAAELSNTPGSKFSYNNKAVNLLAGVIYELSGQKMDKYIEENIFKFLGINEFEWTCDLSGNPYQLEMLPQDLLKIGILVLNRGRYNDKQIIKSDWFNESLNSSQEYFPAYGLLWWLIPGKVTFIVDDKQINKLKEAKVNADFIEKAINVMGKYEIQKDYYAKLESIFGSDWQQVLDDNLLSLNMSLSNKEYEYIGVNANGWLGQYLVIYPEKKIVGVRMIKKTKEYNDNTDSFSNFQEMLYEVL